jgi:hypothetical protein
METMTPFRADYCAQPSLERKEGSAENQHIGAAGDKFFEDPCNGVPMIRMETIVNPIDVLSSAAQLTHFSLAAARCLSTRREMERRARTPTCA